MRIVITNRVVGYEQILSSHQKKLSSDCYYLWHQQGIIPKSKHTFRPTNIQSNLIFFFFLYEAKRTLRYVGNVIVLSLSGADLCLRP